MEVFETGELNFTCTPTFLSLMEVFEADELGGDGGSMRRLQLLAARTSSGAAASPQPQLSPHSRRYHMGSTHLMLGPCTSFAEVLWL